MTLQSVGGFIKTPWTTVDTIKEVRTFTDEGKASWRRGSRRVCRPHTRNGMPTRERGRPVDEKGTETDLARPPYEANSTRCHPCQWYAIRYSFVAHTLTRFPGKIAVSSSRT